MGDDDQKKKIDDSQAALGTVGAAKEPSSTVDRSKVGLGKEQEPGVGATAEIRIKEAPSEHREVEPEKEVGEFVKPTPVAPKIPADVKKAGVKHTGPTTPVQKKPSKTITLPLTDDEIVRGLHAHVWQSLHWLAAWCIRKLKKAHIVVKEVHGRLVRS